MNVDHPDEAVSRIAAAIGEPARARMLYCLADGRARTSTELGVVGQVSPSTASVHLNRLKTERLVNVFAQGKHRYYSLSGTSVADALEALSVVAGRSHARVRAEHAESPAGGAHLLRPHGRLGGGATPRSLHGAAVADAAIRAASTRYDLTSAGVQGVCRRSASTSTRHERCGAVSRSRASTGASGGRTSAAPLARRC